MSSEITDFIEAIDRAWKGPNLELRILGSTALFLQEAYERGTKDSDVLRTHALSGGIREELLVLAGAGSQLARKHRVYLDVVSPNVPMLPPEPLWHHHPLRLEHFTILVLDVTDVVVSKLKRYSATDQDDILAMIERDCVPHARLVDRFREVAEHYRFDGRSQYLEKMAQRINQLERDEYLVEETRFELPEDI